MLSCPWRHRGGGGLFLLLLCLACHGDRPLIAQEMPSGEAGRASSLWAPPFPVDREPPSGASVKWYISSPAGHARRRIPSFRADEFEWVLQVTRWENFYREELFHHQELYQQRDGVMSGGQKRREILYRGGKPFEYILRDAAGLVIAEVFFRDGRAAERREYLYRDGLLQRILRILPEGGKAVQEVRRGEAGRLLSLAGDSFSVHWRWNAEGRLFNVGLLEGEEFSYIGYDEKGRQIRQGRGDPGKNREIEVAFNEDGTRLEVEENPGNGERVESLFNSEDQLIRQRVYREGQLSSEELYRWDEDNLLYRKRIVGYEKQEWFLSYDPGGRLRREEFFVNGELKARLGYGEEEREVERLYHQGELLLKVYRQRGQRLAEIFYQDGEKRRQRIYSDQFRQEAFQEIDL